MRGRILGVVAGILFLVVLPDPENTVSFLIGYGVGAVSILIVGAAIAMLGD